MSLPLRKSMVLATMLAAGGFTAICFAAPAAASHTGTASVLTSSNHPNIQIQGAGTFTPYWWSPEYQGWTNAIVADAQWSPDGSRAVYVNHNNTVQTVRFNDNYNYWFVALGDKNWDGNPEIYYRGDATYTASGSTVLWTERLTASSRLRIMATSSSFGWTPWEVTTAEDNVDYSDPDGGKGRIVFVRQADGGAPEIWISDDVSEGTASHKVTDGNNPALSPDGTKIAFRGPNTHLWTINVDGTGLDQVDEDAGEYVAYGKPAWNHDGSVIAFKAGTSHDSPVRTVPAAGGVSTLVAGMYGNPAYRTQQVNKAVRLAGASRFETATAVSKYWRTADNGSDTRPQAASVVLSRSDTFADALGGSALAAAKQAPLLLTEPTKLTEATKAEIQRVLGTNPSAIVYVLGSAGAISNSVEQAVKDLGYKTERLAGPDRFATSVAIADEINPDPDLILAATGVNFPDALAAGAAAGSYNVPGSGWSAVVVLTDNSKLPTATADYLQGHADTPTYAIGRSAAQAIPAADDEYVGEDRYETAAMVAASFFGGQRSAGVATGLNWPDALAGGALMGTLNGPLLLTNGTASELEFEPWFHLNANSASISTVYVFGSSAVVKEAQLNEAGTFISGNAGFTKGTTPVSFEAGSMLRGPGAKPSLPTAHMPKAVFKR